MVQILQPTPENLAKAAEALAEGRLVALPTETVYGLGGNALIESAAKHIYTVKGRPATDPLICHVDNLERAQRLWDPAWDATAMSLATTIGAALWPGPLTIVGKANPALPECVSSGSGWVGARIPDHPVALALLALVDFPVAAPSANTFGHVSPTTAQHVYDDLASREDTLLIVDGGSCPVGIESTVIKVNSADSIEVLRRGKMTVSAIHAAIAATHPHTRIEIRDTRSKFTADTPMDGPGQLLTHYSPGVPASLLTPGSLLPCTRGEGVGAICRGSDTFPFATTVVIDFHGILAALQGTCLAYRDLSAKGSATEACFEVFEALRWSEHIQGATNVVFPFLSEWPRGAGEADEDLLAAVEDRLFRAASGTTAVCSIQT